MDLNPRVTPFSFSYCEGRRRQAIKSGVAAVFAL
jgi:hypothetical protein